jgi:hypothetical protein
MADAARQIKMAASAISTNTRTTPLAVACLGAGWLTDWMGRRQKN